MNIKYSLFLALCFLSGCKRYYNWSKQFFAQADKRDLHTSCIKPYHTYITVHDGFTTVGWFDLLWMADPVWDWYNNNVAIRYGLTADALQKLEDDQAAENSAYITFYILMSQPNVPTDPLPRLGTNTASQWSIVLAVDGQEYQAKEIKLVDLSPELQEFFGLHYNRYRNVYRVKFARHVNSNPLEKESVQESADLLDAETMELRLRSIKHEVDFMWDHETGTWCIPQLGRPLVQ